jgi:nucleoside-diphosphate-sugar epimerase
VLRLSNVYGSGMTNNIFNHIYKEFMSQNKIVKINNALNTRDFIHVSDICSAITTYITDIKSGIYNIGTGEGTSIKDLCNIFAAKLKVNKSAYHVKSISQDDTMLVLDSNKFRNSYNWEPKINIDAGIASWVKDYKRELSDAK